MYDKKIGISRPKKKSICHSSPVLDDFCQGQVSISRYYFLDYLESNGLFDFVTLVGESTSQSSFWTVTVTIFSSVDDSFACARESLQHTLKWDLI